MYFVEVHMADFYVWHEHTCSQHCTATHTASEDINWSKIEIVEEKGVMGWEDCKGRDQKRLGAGY